MIRTDGERFVDELGRTCILRGVNLGGSSKVPSRGGDGDSRDISFVDRPFPLAEAEEHFRRLRAWGLCFNRLLVSWEAVEHHGPGEYDREYLDYLEAVLARGAALGHRFVVDFHQDTWSRLTGGDGAPGWTLEVAGLNARTLHACGAAVLHHELGGRMPNLLWSTNYGKLGAATMSTLFFGGDAFAPELRFEGSSIQSFLQARYVGFVRAVAVRLAHLDAVAGFDLMNEPSAGYIGYPDLASERFLQVRNAATPSPFDGMAAGAGFRRAVPVYRMTLLGFLRTGRRVINPEGASAWLPGAGCPWLRHGVWTVRAGAPVLLRPDYFTIVGDRRVSFGADFLRPFYARIGCEIRSVRSDTLLFIEDAPRWSGLRWSAGDGEGAVLAGHWYDALTMFSKRRIPWLCVDSRTLRPAVGRRAVAASFHRQIGEIARAAAGELGGIPSFVGEFGLPFDLDGGLSFRTGHFGSQAAALGAYYDALDANLLGATLWNYTADNTHADGDGWNSEDFSVYCREDGGGRAVEGFARPYATRIAGSPLRMRYDRARGRFTLAFGHDAAARGGTDVFIPSHLARGGFRVSVTDGAWSHDAERQLLTWMHDPARSEHGIVVEFTPAASGASRRRGARS